LIRGKGEGNENGEGKGWMDS
jgi:hypothetical protein